ncbi:MAG: 30S ribosomal protein S20 [Candidatus Omnitrophota bacterium]
MPIKRAAYKAIRSDKKKHLRNVSAISGIRTLYKNVLQVIKTKDKSKIESALRTLISAMDKAAQKGIIHKKTASRKKSRISTRVFKSLS